MADVLNAVETARTEKTPYAARYDNFIGGKWAPPLAGRYFDNPSPVDGHKLCEVARSDAEDIDGPSTRRTRQRTPGGAPAPPNAP